MMRDASYYVFWGFAFMYASLVMMAITVNHPERTNFVDRWVAVTSGLIALRLVYVGLTL